jgi:hypothetical protein
MKKILCSWACAPFDRGPGLVPPAGNRRFVALACPSGRLLQAPAHRFAQTANMDRVIREAKCQSNHGGDPATGPQLASEPVASGLWCSRSGRRVS